MTTAVDTISDLANREYKYGFETDVEADSIATLSAVRVDTSQDIARRRRKERRLSLQPNPAQAQTTLSYTLDKTEDVKIELYDLVGKRLEQIENSKQSAGEHHITIQKPGAGMFLLKVKAGDRQVIQKVVFECLLVAYLSCSCWLDRRSQIR